MSDYEASSQSNISCISDVASQVPSQGSEEISEMTGYLAGDEEGLESSNAESSEGWASEAASDAVAPEVQGLRMDLVVAHEINEAGNEIDHGLEEVGDSEEIEEPAVTNNEIGDESDTESMTDEPVRGGSVKNLKRRRVFAYGPERRARH